MLVVECLGLELQLVVLIHSKLLQRSGTCNDVSDNSECLALTAVCLAAPSFALKSHTTLPHCNSSSAQLQIQTQDQTLLLYQLQLSQDSAHLFHDAAISSLESDVYTWPNMILRVHSAFGAIAFAATSWRCPLSAATCRRLCEGSHCWKAGL